MRAMTWWDHETESVWSQPWGMAMIGGPLEGTRLSLIPAGVVPWAAWEAEHPETLVLDLPGYGGKRFSSEFVIGIALGEHAKAFPFEIAKEVVVNDKIGDFPVVVLVDAETNAIHSFLRTTQDRDLEFTLKDGQLVDLQTGSSWDASRGIAVGGPLQGEVLQQIPYITSFDWAWEDFYPHTEFFRGVDPS